MWLTIYIVGMIPFFFVFFVVMWRRECDINLGELIVMAVFACLPIFREFLTLWFLNGTGVFDRVIIKKKLQ